MMDKDCDLKIRENLLYQIKEQPPTRYSLPSKPLTGFACKDCSPSTAKSRVDPILRHSKVVRDVLRGAGNGVPYSTQGSHSFFATWAPHIAQALACRKFPYPQVSGMVLGTERLNRALDQATLDTLHEEKLKKKKPTDKDSSFDADSSSDDSTFSSNYLDFNNKRIKEIRKKHEERAKRILLDMRSKLSDIMLRVTSWMLYKLLPCFLRGVAAHPAQIDMLRDVAESAKDIPLIFMPLHRSHLDYILISFILLNNNIRSPLVAAGNNLRIPFFGSLLRGLGAFYIKRRIDPADGKKDHVYRAVLHTYLQKCLGAGHNVEFFIEGGRTRTGKPCMPKGGILSVIVDAFLDGTIPDALLIPVSVHYERLVDGNFISEQLGRSKSAESFSSAVRAIWTTLHSDYGVMRIDFNEPLSIKDLIEAFRSRQQLEQQRQLTEIGSINPADRCLRHETSTTSLYGTDVVQEEIRTLVDSIGRHIVYDSAKATAVMSTNAAAFLLLTRHRDGCYLEELATELDQLRIELESDSRNLGFSGQSIDVLDYAVSLLGSDLIEKRIKNDKVYVKPVTALPNVIELSYYSNSLTPFYALKSVVVTCMEYLQNHNNGLVMQHDLINISLELCDMLRYEFILSKPCQSLERLLLDTIDNLCGSDILIVPQKFYTDDEKWSRRCAATLDICDNSDDDSYNGYEGGDASSHEIKVGTSVQALQSRASLVSVLSPLMNAYLCTAKTLNKLLDGPVAEAEFIQLTLQEIQQQIENNFCQYGESVSSDSVRNALKLFAKWGVVENCFATDSSKRTKMLALSLHWDTIDGIQTIIEKLERYNVPFSKKN
ncbi:glycerol-3-phosphate acyltransferase 1, mitochondrial-like [Ctenocephalides felis]|uniref:glycerol-3-phosphate acyltransferase 1, mitochondrial-like n=1 Tax=Ctenocephalides felis TaxID=7515 RepID=UPI000E6E2647|nr:glycerol-3-phosphate acyltransferase 1, mitochondrial-like [Ctenocephalides felis]